MTISIYTERQKPEDALKINEDETKGLRKEIVMYEYEIDGELVEGRTPFSTVTDVPPTQLPQNAASKSDPANHSTQSELEIEDVKLPPALYWQTAECAEP